MAAMRTFDSRRALYVWGGALLALAAVIVAGNVALARHAALMRDLRPQTYIDRAQKAMEAGDFTGALAHWEEAYARAPGLHSVHKVRGDIYYAWRKWEDALAAYREALRLGSPAPGVRLNAVWSLVELGRYEEARDFGLACIQDGFQDPDLSRRTAEACFRGKLFADAVPLYELALAGYPRDLYLMEHLRQSCQQVGQMQKAREIQARIERIQSSMSTQSMQSTKEGIS